MQTQSNKIDFKGQKIFAGFDVHLKSWKVTIMTKELTHKTFSQDPKPEVLVDYLTRHFPGGTYYSAYEAGFCGYWIHNRLLELGVNSIVVHAADVPTTGKEKVNKDDKRDSKKIARSLRNEELNPIHVPSIATIEDRGLVRLRTTKVKELARYKCRIKSHLYLHGIEYPEAFSNTHTHWSNRFNKWLESIEMTGPSGKATLDDLLESSNHLRTAILKITRQIRVLSKTDHYRLRQELLRSIPGIGYITAMIILTEIETINRFANFDKLCGYIGLIPSTNSSGEKEKVGNLTPRGHTLRSAIIESAWVAARLDPALCKSYHDYCTRMEPNKAIIRIARKLLSRIMYVLKNNKPYVCSVVR
ncbi:MAG: IS110 family transposase [Bacteroidetes bacterium GWF2_49_14]|nr:MAG: IS110 family transposase [Bacteroidetes bacterium GWF2_49_14]